MNEHFDGTAVPYTFVSVNRRSDEARAHISPLRAHYDHYARVLRYNTTRSSADAEIARHASRWMPPKHKTPHFPVPNWSTSVEFRITGRYDPYRLWRHGGIAKTSTYLMSHFHFFVLCLTAIRQRYRQTDRQTDVMLVAYNLHGRLRRRMCRVPLLTDAVSFQSYFVLSLNF